jgi:2-polyprenyl-3-methyl-5-hydroxy-6-metoxy-1,4-benzoquinol methylase
MSINTQHLRGNVQDFIAGYVRGKTVLDVGCVQHTATHAQGDDRWLHKRVVANAKSALGLDILESEVTKLRQYGYEVVCGDACTVSLERTFDVVLAGEIIEHVSNASAFLSNMARHVTDGGRLVLTTPNAYFLLHVFESIFCDPDHRWNPEHVCIYEPFTLRNLLRRNGLDIETMYYFTRSSKLLRLMWMTGLPSYGPISGSILAIVKKAE